MMLITCQGSIVMDITTDSSCLIYSALEVTWMCFFFYLRVQLAISHTRLSVSCTSKIQKITRARYIDEGIDVANDLGIT